MSTALRDDEEEQEPTEEEAFADGYRATIVGLGGFARASAERSEKEARKLPETVWTKGYMAGEAAGYAYAAKLLQEYADDAIKLDIDAIGAFKTR